LLLATVFGRLEPRQEQAGRLARLPVKPKRENPPTLPNPPKRKTADDIVWGSKDKDARMLAQFCRLFSHMEAGDLAMVPVMAQKMAQRKAV
jgi:hypothetical protein